MLIDRTASAVNGVSRGTTTSTPGVLTRRGPTRLSRPRYVRRQTPRAASGRTPGQAHAQPPLEGRTAWADHVCPDDELTLDARRPHDRSSPCRPPRRAVREADAYPSSMRRSRSRNSADGSPFAVRGLSTSLRQGSGNDGRARLHVRSIDASATASRCRSCGVSVAPASDRCTRSAMPTCRHGAPSSSSQASMSERHAAARSRSSGRRGAAPWRRCALRRRGLLAALGACRSARSRIVAGAFRSALLTARASRTT